MIFISGKVQTGMCNRSDTAANTLAAGTPAPVLRFLQAKKRKQGPVTTDYRYTSHFISWVRKQVRAIGQASGIFSASYFG